MQLKKVIIIVGLALLFVAAIIGFLFFGPATKATEDGFFYVKSGATIADVKTELVAQQVLKGTGLFTTVSNIAGYENVKPGRYKIPSGTSIVNLVRLLKNGRQTPVNFVITKLRTKENLASRINKHFEVDSLAIINFVDSPDSLKPYGLDSSTFMAMVMPYTYDVNWTASPRTIFDQFYKAYQTYWNADRKAKAGAKGLTPEQVVIFASIVEEETRDNKEKPDIASVYINRYRKNMLLQADPTVKFALKDFGLRRILHIHLKAESPYNTYRNKGLPPGPICTPSLESIDAVLNASETEYIYFVANSDFKGSHIFTTNYADHLKYAKLFQTELTRRTKEKQAAADSAAKK